MNAEGGEKHCRKREEERRKEGERERGGKRQRMREMANK